jgi:hypothetical protein
MGRLAIIHPVTSAILTIMSHSVIFLRKEGPFYSIHDWLPEHGWSVGRMLRPVAYSAIALVGVLRYGSGDDLVNAECVNTSIDS